MFSNKLFFTAFLVSLTIHGAVLFQTPNFNFLPSSNINRKVQVSYIKTLPTPAKVMINNKTGSKREPLLKIPDRITARKIAPPPFIDREAIFNKRAQIALSESSIPRPVFAKPDVIAIKKKITLPPIEMNKIDNPSYITYYQIVREKIKRAAYQNYTRTETGEVYVTFIITDAGYLKESRIIDDKSSSNQYLKDIALRSLTGASPFPNFPKELDYPYLSFNVVISFEIE